MKNMGISLSHLSIDYYESIMRNLEESSISLVEIYYAGLEKPSQFWEKIKNIQINLNSIHCRKDLFFLPKEYVIEYMKNLIFLRGKIPDNVFFLFHPNKNARYYISYLQELQNVAIENTIPGIESLLDFVYSNNFYLVYDVAHANYFGGQFELIHDERLIYIHLKGYRESKNCLLRNSDMKHTEILSKLPDNKTYILEYPYNSINEMYQDIFFVKKYFRR